ncbi:MAG: hypothetical protein K2P84_05250 [Undibacterium sp.]|nr:hypothetical protein [Undibacterium sp.]
MSPSTNEQRDYYLQNLGIGERWILRSSRVEELSPDASIRTKADSICSVLFVNAAVSERSTPLEMQVNTLSSKILATLQQSVGSQIVTAFSVSSEMDVNTGIAHLDQLRHEISQLKPKVLFIFGAQIASALLSVETMTSTEMRLAPRLYYHGIPVVVTHTLSFLLDYPQHKRDTWTDICALKQLLA